jgi:hypothetical protein
VVFETEITAYTGDNGDDHFRNVVLDMLPTPAGKLLDNDWNEGLSETRSYAWSYKPYVEDINDLAVAAFIQERQSKKIIQVALDYKNLEVGKSDLLSDQRGLHIYPNPAHQLIHVNLGHRTKNVGKIEIFDVHGRLVHAETIPPAYQIIQLNTDQLRNGMYILRWSESGKVKAMNKVVVSH